MILVVGGTKEGERVTQLLRSKGFTQDGEVANLKSVHGEKVLNGVVFLPRYLNCPMTVHLIRRYGVKVLVDATPIYFKNASLKAMTACKKTRIEYVRFEAPSVCLKEKKGLYRVKDFREACEKAMSFGKVIFLNVGSHNIDFFAKKAVEMDKEIVVRVSEIGALTSCLNFGIKHHNILFIEGIFSREFNQALIREYGISVFVTRDLTEGEGTTLEVEAALAEKIPVVLIERPKLNYKKIITDYSELCDLIQKFNLD